MTTWLCRIMAAVFTFNVLSPAELWAQTQRPSAGARLGQTAPIPTTEDIRAQVEEKFKDDVASAQQAYEEAKGVQELYNAINKLHAVMGTRAAEQSRRQADADRRRQREQERQNYYTQQADAVRVARPALSAAPVNLTPSFEAFAAKLNSGEMSVADLVLYLDPLEGGDLMSTVFAAEILGNSVDAMGSNEEDSTPEMSDFLLEVQLRALYRLKSLLGHKEGSSSYLMAVGSLRLLLLKVNEFFKRAGMPNPLFEAVGGASAASGSGKKARAQAPTEMVRVQGLDGHIMFVSRPVKGSSAGRVQIQAPEQLFSEALYRKMMNDFMAEVREYRDQDLNKEDSKYELMLLLLQYAVSYAMDFDPSQVTTMVGYFDKGPKKTDIEQQYTAVLNAILTTVFENVKFTPGSDKHSTAIRMFLDFSNPEKYSMPTRIFALEMASLLYNTQYQPKEVAAKNMPQSTGNTLFYGFTMNTSTVDDSLRHIFATRTVDIYAPLNRTHYLAIKDYGLDSDQMKVLADKLAHIYNGFANDDLKWDTSRFRDKRSYVLDRAEDGRSLILNDINSVPLLKPFGHGHMFELPDGSLKEISGFGRSSQGFWVEMNLTNGINPKKRSDEINMSMVMFLGEAVLWVFGGEIIGIAWRVTRGAMVALPKAVRAASLANKGRRALSFGIEIKKGVRYANLAYTTRLNGISVAATRVEEVRKPAAAAAEAASASAAPANALRLAPPPVTTAPAGTPLLGAAETAASASSSQAGWWGRTWSRIWPKKPYTVVEESVTSPITSMRGFRNSRGWWRGSRAPVDEWTVLIQEPGFSFQAATLSGPRAARLRNGIQNWDDWRYLMHSARTAEGKRLNFTTPLKPWSSLWNGIWKPMFGASTTAGTVQSEQRVMGITGRAFAQDAKKGVGEGVFDYWKYTEKGWVRINQKEFVELGEGLNAAAQTVPDYYAVLGVSRDATAQELKAAHRKLSKIYHPDKPTGSNELFREINEAWKTLGDDAARAAYDVKLASAPTKVGNIVLPESPEGVSLAITRNMGENVPGAFSPLSKTGNGLGFNSSNWGAVDVQLSQHLSQTGQLDVLGSKLVMADPLIGGTSANAVFFGSWAALDQAVNPFMQNWINQEGTAAIAGMQQKFGDAYDPALMAEDQRIADENLREMQEQGYNTASPSLYDTVTGAKQQSAMGALISFPVLASWHGLARTGLGNKIGLSSPFEAEQTRTILKIGADRIQTQRMVRKYQDVKTQQDFDAFYTTLQQAVKDAKQSYQTAFAQYKQMPGANLAALEKEVLGYFDEFTRTSAKIAGGSDTVVKKYNNLNAAWEAVIAKCPEFDEKLMLQTFAPQGEAAFFKQMISDWEKSWDSYKNDLYYYQIDQTNPEIIAKADVIFKNLIGQLRKLQKKRMSFSAKYQEVMGITSAAEDKIQALSESIKPAASAASELTLEDLRTMEASFINMAEAEAKQAGLALDAFFRAWRAEASAYYNDDTYTVEDLQMALNLLNSDKLEELDKLFIKANEAKTVQPAAETSTLSSEGLDELLPDETSAVFTGA